MTRRNAPRPLLRAALSAAIVLAALAGCRAPSGGFVAASDPRFVFEGRVDDADRAAPVLIWQASRVRIDFEGQTLALRFAEASDQCFLNADIDGRTSLVELRRGRPAQGVAFSGLGAGRHSLVLFKRSEASAGTVAFLGIDVSPGAGAWAPRSPGYRLAMEFIGDSITAGACDEDGASDQWDDRRSHNNALSYGALASGALGADYRDIAVSGMGVAAGWASVRAGEVWDALYPRAGSTKENPADWTPDVILVNLGENDDSFTRAHQQPFPAGYTQGYVDLVVAIRRAHPGARIVMLRGGMFGGAKSERLRKAWDSAVAQVEAADPLASHFVFAHWTSNHPRVEDHRAMAGELAAWLRGQPFMRRFL